MSCGICRSARPVRRAAHPSGGSSGPRGTSGPGHRQRHSCRRAPRTRSYRETAVPLRTAPRLLSCAPERAALLPLIIDQAVAHDNLVPLAAQALIMSKRYVGALSYGMHNAVACTEDVPFVDATKIDR